MGSLPVWLHAADLLLIPPSRAPLDQFKNCVLPIKLFSYLAAGRPILAPEAPDTAELLADGGNALLVPPGEPETAARALDRLLGDSKLADRLSAASRAVVRSRRRFLRRSRRRGIHDDGRRLMANGGGERGRHGGQSPTC